jgi:hypothetical protein
MKEVLIVGNSPHAKQVLMNRIDSRVLVIGINRVYKLFWPHVLFFNDPEIIDELITTNTVIPSHVRLFTTTYFIRKLVRSKTVDSLVNDRITVLDYLYAHNAVILEERKYPFSVLVAMSYVARIVEKPITNIRLTLAGVDLNAAHPGHFYSENINLIGCPSLEPQRVKLHDMLQRRTEHNLPKEIFNSNDDSKTLTKCLPLRPLKCLYVIQPPKQQQQQPTTNKKGRIRRRSMFVM